MKNSICPICEEGHLLVKMEMNTVWHSGVTRDLPLHYSECDTCGSVTATAEQTRENKRGMIAFKKEVDGFLTGNEILALRKQLGVTQMQAANIFGGGPVAFSKYEKDDVTQSEPMDKLLRVIRRFPMAAAWLAKESGEEKVAKHVLSERFPDFDVKPFVTSELKASIDTSVRRCAHFRYLKLEKPQPPTVENLNVG